MTLDFAWGIATWVISSVVGGLIAAWVAGQRAQRIKDRIGNLEDGVKILEDGVKQAAAKEWVAARVDALHEITAKAAAREWVQGQIDGERAGRERIHREIDAMNARLSAGDAKFDSQMVELTKLAGSLRGTASELSAFENTLAEFVRKELCDSHHKGVEFRLGALERQRRGDA